MREQQASDYTRRLRHGVGNDAGGILAECDQGGKELFPYDHQRYFVQTFCKEEFAVMAHEAGTGKTATACQLYAAHWLLHGKGSRMIVTTLTGTLDQWENTAHDWLNLPDKKTAICSNNKAASITRELLDRTLVLITTRHCLANAFRACHRWTKTHHKNDRGQWVGGCVDPEVPMHLLEPDANGQPWFSVMRGRGAQHAQPADHLDQRAQAALRQRALGYGATATPVFNSLLTWSACVATVRPSATRTRCTGR